MRWVRAAASSPTYLRHLRQRQPRPQQGSSLRNAAAQPCLRWSSGLDAHRVTASVLPSPLPLSLPSWACRGAGHHWPRPRAATSRDVHRSRHRSGHADQGVDRSGRGTGDAPRHSGGGKDATYAGMGASARRQLRDRLASTRRGPVDCGGGPGPARRPPRLGAKHRPGDRSGCGGGGVERPAGLVTGV
jgi:hypothetical protein